MYQLQSLHNIQDLTTQPRNNTITAVTNINTDAAAVLSEVSSLVNLPVVSNISLLKLFLLEVAEARCDFADFVVQV